MKQTALEFLLEELPKLAALSDFLDKEDFIKARTIIFEKAIKMEKEQIMDAFNYAQIELGMEADEYYEQTFKSE